MLELYKVSVARVESSYDEGPESHQRHADSEPIKTYIIPHAAV